MPCHVTFTQRNFYSSQYSFSHQQIYHAYTQKKSPSKQCFGRHSTRNHKSQPEARGGQNARGKIDPRSFKAVSASGPSQRVANSTLALARPASVRRERSPVRAHAPQTVLRDNARRAHSQSVETRRSCQTSQLLRWSSPTRTCF